MIEVKERPIIMSAPSVRAILAGTKTQTRRPLYVATTNCASAREDRRYPPDYGNSEHPNLPPGHAWTLSGWRKAKPGDRLWVRENGWERPHRTAKMLREGADTWAPYYFDADGLSEDEHAELKAWGFKRRPSIHMPRCASRITLEITGVRVERLQDISRADAKAEGCRHDDPCDHTRRTCDEIGCQGPDYRIGYRNLWESLHGPGSWDANPLVWVIEFRRIKP